MNRIAEFRDRFRLTQDECGLLFGRGRGTISAWESGKTAPDWNAISTIHRWEREQEHVVRAEVNRLRQSDRGNLADLDELSSWILNADATTRPRFRDPNDPNDNRFTVERGFAQRKADFLTLQRLATIGLADGGALVGDRTAEAIGTPAINARLSRLGVTYLGVSDTTDIGVPIFETELQPYWLGEGDFAPEAAATLVKLNVSFKTLGVGLVLSRQLLRLTGEAGMRAFSGAITRAMTREIDRVALVGTGIGPEPLGIANHDLVTVDTSSIDFETAFWNSVRDLEQDGIDSERLRIVAHPTLVAKLRRLNDTAAVQEDWVIKDGRQTFRGIPALSVPSFREDSLLIGDFSRVIVRLNRELDLRIFDTSRADGGHALYCFADLAIEVPQARLSFRELSGVFA